MTASRQLKLGAFMRPVSLHTGAWRYPGAYPDANFNFAHLKSFTQTLERAKFDAFFMADHMAVLNMPVDALKRSHTVTSFEPFTLLSALAGATEHIGLVATGSTTFDAPYHIARRFASLDHISGGRAGWNIVTTSNPDAALNFGLDEHMEHGERYRRAREFYDVVTGLWDSFADDAFVRDVEHGIYFDPDKMHVLDHKGKYLSVRGPLNIARPIQGWPVIVQAGASEPGRQLAAETAEAVFTAQSSLAVGREFYADVKRRAEKVGRSRDHIKILPGCLVVVGDTVEEARAKRAKLDSLVHYANAIGSLSIALGHDASKLRSGRATTRYSREQRQQERPAAGDRPGAAGKSHRAATRPAPRRPFRPRLWLGRPRPSPTRWRNGCSPKAPTASPCSSPTCPAGSTTSSTTSCRNCSAAASSGANTKARPCAKIWGCRGPRTGSLRTARARSISLAIGTTIWCDARFAPCRDG